MAMKPIDLNTNTSSAETVPRWYTVEESTDRFFAWFDGNKDGTITVAEIVAAVDPSGHQARELNGVVGRIVDLMDPNHDAKLSKAEVTAALDALDTNGDGSLTPADLGRELAHQGLSPVLAVMLQGGPVPGPPQRDNAGVAIGDVVDTLLTRFDANGNAALTLTELLAVLDPGGHRQKLKDALTPLAADVDTNHDGAMSKAELTTAVSSLDGNGNGRLDHGDQVAGPHSADDIDLIGVLLPKFRHFDGMGPDSP
jgi:Ca2+-binding EF-hand superfamily protein